MIGVAMLIDAIYKLQYSFELKTAEVGPWWVLLLISLATLIMAAVLMIQPFQEQKSMAIFTGVILAVNGLFDWTVVAFTTVFAKKLIAVKEALKEEGEIGQLPSPKKRENTIFNFESRLTRNFIYLNFETLHCYYSSCFIFFPLNS